MAEPIEWSGLVLSVTGSLGFTSVGINERFDDVLHRADKAMYTAKRDGKNRSLAGSSSTTVLCPPDRCRTF